MILDVNGLEFRYSGASVLNDVSFSVSPGEILAILGPNGVGKTTLLKCINAIHRARKGTVFVDSRNVLDLRPEEVARTIGYVAQHAETARITVFDAVLMGRKPHMRWRVASADLRMVESILRHLHLDHLMLRHIDCLSGGELQKVGLARALVQEPRLLLLDEPTSSLDLKNAVDIMTLLRRVVDEHQVAAVMTMHDLNTALRVADKVLFLKGGRIHACCACEDVLPDMIAEVYGLPVEVHVVAGNPVVLPAAPPHPDHRADPSPAHVRVH